MVRSRSRTPTRASKRDTARLTADAVRPNASAARTMVPASTTADRTVTPESNRPSEGHRSLLIFRNDYFDILEIKSAIAACHVTPSRRRASRPSTRRSSMYAVTGASGKVGGAVANTLLAAGKDVRVVVRNAQNGKVWADRGCKIAVAEIEDVAAMTAAFRGCRRRLRDAAADVRSVARFRRGACHDRGAPCRTRQGGACQARRSLDDRRGGTPAQSPQSAGTFRKRSPISRCP